MGQYSFQKVSFGCAMQCIAEWTAAQYVTTRGRHIFLVYQYNWSGSVTTDVTSR